MSVGANKRVWPHTMTTKGQCSIKSSLAQIQQEKSNRVSAKEGPKIKPQLKKQRQQCKRHLQKLILELYSHPDVAKQTRKRKNRITFDYHKPAQ